MNVQELIDEIILTLPDNTSGAITPEILRNILTEFANRSELKSISENSILQVNNDGTISMLSLSQLIFNSQEVLLNSNDLVSLNAVNTIEIATAILSAIIGGQINLTSGDSTTIEAGANLTLRSLLNQVIIESARLDIECTNTNGVQITSPGQVYVETNYFEVYKNTTSRITKEDSNGGVGDYLTLRQQFGNIEIWAFNGSTKLQSNTDNIILEGSTGGLPIYANDAAADADTNLSNGALYKLTGNRTVFQKP